MPNKSDKNSAESSFSLISDILTWVEKLAEPKRLQAPLKSGHVPSNVTDELKEEFVTGSNNAPSSKGSGDGVQSTDNDRKSNQESPAPLGVRSAQSTVGGITEMLHSARPVVQGATKKQWAARVLFALIVSGGTLALLAYLHVPATVAVLLGLDPSTLFLGLFMLTALLVTGPIAWGIGMIIAYYLPGGDGAGGEQRENNHNTNEGVTPEINTVTPRQIPGSGDQSKTTSLRCNGNNGDEKDVSAAQTSRVTDIA